MKMSFVLTGEGLSDLNLVDHIETLLIRAGFLEVSGTRFDPSRLPMHVGHSVREKLQVLTELYPSADVIFVHRDADAQGMAARQKEIKAACDGICDSDLVIPTIPVRMLETWLLVDSRAIRRVAGKMGQDKIECIPALKNLEHVADSKKLLLDALCECSELQGIKLKNLRIFLEKCGRDLFPQ
ncbi:hypothetical protein [Xanthomonas axonopodis]|uniref:hypothetical protein n=1 Tax=Xanthomonas axonopodis TaxID=53413 RepID=UPI0010725015|nr:hypothetical protein [Xanthomonas axonopodis]